MSSRKGQKAIKNIPILYDEIKCSHNIMVTDTAWNILKAAAKSEGISISEYVERMARRLKSPTPYPHT